MLLGEGDHDAFRRDSIRYPYGQIVIRIHRTTMT